MVMSFFWKMNIPACKTPSYSGVEVLKISFLLFKIHLSSWGPTFQLDTGEVIFQELLVYSNIKLF